MSEAALEAGLATLVLRMALACWAACGTLLLTDARKSVNSLLLMLAGITAACSLRGILLAGYGWTSACWWCSFLAACLLLALKLRSWLKTSPSEYHEEARGTQATAPASSRRLASQISSDGDRKKAAAVNRWAIAFVFVGLLASGAALALGIGQHAQWSNVQYALATLHVLASSCLLGLTIASGLELSWLSAPETLNPASGKGVAWSRIAGLAIVLTLFELVVCVAVFNSSSEVTQDAELAMYALARVFGLTLLVISFNAWFIPQRVVHLQRSGQSKGWTSLALSAWITTLALTVVCGLPDTWPWAMT